MSQPKRRVINTFTLSMINLAAICNIANLPFAAKYGFSSLFFFALMAFCFFIPVGLISAELATGWPERGGIYIWVREALGERTGFIAIWLQWVENVIWYPTILSYSAATIAYAFSPSLAENKAYIAISIILFFWIITAINLRGMKISGWISTICVIIGTLLPGTIIILLSAFAIIKGTPSQITFNLKEFIPSFDSASTYSLLAAILLSYGGLEMSAVHAKEVENPQKEYPKAIFLSAIVIMIFLSLGSLSISYLVPKEKIELASGSIEAFQYLFQIYHTKWAVPLIALLMTLGSLGTISTWTVGPSKGLVATARHGELPPFLQKMNKKAMPIAILFLQACIVSLLCLVFVFMPNVSASYHLLFYLTAQLYLIMYIMMFLAGIVLRYKFPKTHRAFKIPFGKHTGMWVVATIGILTSLLAIFAGFIPPPDLPIGNIFFFKAFLIVGLLIFCCIPILIHKIKKPSWHIFEKE